MCRHCRPYIDINNPQGMQLDRFKNRTPARFEYIYCTLFPLCHSNQDMYPFLKEASFCPFLFCVYDSSVLQNFKIFIHLLPNFSYKDPRMTEVTYHCINFNDRFRKVPKISPDIILGRYFEIMTRLGTISKTSLGFNNRSLLVVVNG